MRGVHVWKRKHAATVVIFLCGAYDYLNVWSSSIITTSWIERLHVTRQHTWWYSFWCFCLTFFCSLSLFVLSLPQLMFPGFLSESLQQWVQCAHRRKHTKRKKGTLPSCLMSACSPLHREHIYTNFMTSCLLQSGSGLTPCSCAPAYICIFWYILKKWKKKECRFSYWLDVINTGWQIMIDSWTHHWVRRVYGWELVASPPSW